MLRYYSKGEPNTIQIDSESWEDRDHSLLPGTVDEIIVLCINAGWCAYIVDVVTEMRTDRIEIDGHGVLVRKPLSE